MQDRRRSLWRRLIRRLKGKPPALRDRFSVGRGTYGQPEVLHWGEPATLRVGSFCSFSKGVTIVLGGEHRADWVTTYPFPSFRESARSIRGYCQAKGDVVIGNDVWIAFGATILSGVTIGDGAVVGARSVVTKDVPAYGVVAGSPARLLRKRFSDEEIRLLAQIAWWNWDDETLDRAMPLLLSADIAGLARFARGTAAKQRGHDERLAQQTAA